MAARCGRVWAAATNRRCHQVSSAKRSRKPSSRRRFELRRPRLQAGKVFARCAHFAKPLQQTVAAIRFAAQNDQESHCRDFDLTFRGLALGSLVCSRLSSAQLGSARRASARLLCSRLCSARHCARVGSAALALGSTLGSRLSSPLSAWLGTALASALGSALGVALAVLWCPVLCCVVFGLLVCVSACVIGCVAGCLFVCLVVCLFARLCDRVRLFGFVRDWLVGVGARGALRNWSRFRAQFSSQK